MVDWHSIQALLCRDPARRGLVSSEGAPQILAHCLLEQAARSLADHAQRVALVTGFAVRGPDGLTAETDGPPGTLYLARVLRDLGCDPTIVTDRWAWPTLLAGCRATGFDPDRLVPFPSTNDAPACDVDDWIDQFLSPSGRPWTHLIAIERAGPSHTAASFAAQPRDHGPSWEEFDRYLPPDARDVCHNMRGESIDAHTAPVQRMFEIVEQRNLPIATIGLADGGNEIGMGRIPWELLQQAIPDGLGGRIACRIATHHLAIAGVSNWAAYALALAVAALRDRLDVAAALDLDAERDLIQTLVDEGGAVDGVTRLRQATVDGLPLETYLQTLAGLRRLFDLPA